MRTIDPLRRLRAFNIASQARLCVFRNGLQHKALLHLTAATVAPAHDKGEQFRDSPLVIRYRRLYRLTDSGLGRREGEHKQLKP
ncbi:MAG: hypothetical protein ACI8TQ_003305 [Planctomycetota bacterium]|jgi:hypothetical protein